MALLTGASVRWLTTRGDRVGFDVTCGGGLLGILASVTGMVLPFTGRYPTALFDLIVGFNRWFYRTIAYVALMTDTYPPFRVGLTTTTQLEDGVVGVWLDLTSVVELLARTKRHRPSTTESTEGTT